MGRGDSYCKHISAKLLLATPHFFCGGRPFGQFTPKRRVNLFCFCSPICSLPVVVRAHPCFPIPITVMHDSATKSTLCLIRDALTGDRISLRVRPADTVHSLYEAVRLNMDRSKETIQLLLAPSAPASAAKAPVKYKDDVSVSGCGVRPPSCLLFPVCALFISTRGAPELDSCAP